MPAEAQSAINLHDLSLSRGPTIIPDLVNCDGRVLQPAAAGERVEVSARPGGSSA